jgi:hypothetical protein
LDTSSPSELIEAAEIDLSKEEDNVASLAVGQRKGPVTLVYAGVNSSPKDIEKRKNLHFRVFGIEPVRKNKGKSQEGSSYKIAEISRSSLFAGTEKDIYQRILRLSRPYANQPQLGAVTTGLAKNSELVLFDTAASSPPNSRGALQSSKEVEDVDILQAGNSNYLVGYCDEHDVYVKVISPKLEAELPECVYITPASKSLEKPTVPKFRALRWLTKDYLLMLTNIHSEGGVVLQILRLPPSGKGQCRIAQSNRLASDIKKSSGFAVSNLTPPESPTAPQSYTQFVIAVVGQNVSISLFKVDFQVEGDVSMVTAIKPFRTFKSVHPFPITGIAFSNFTPPPHPITASTPPQYLKLASVSMGNTVIVHTLPLFPVPLSVKRGQSKTPRYVVALPSGAAAMGMGIVVSIVAVCLAAIFLQGILEIRGGVRPWLNATNYIPVSWQEAIGKPYVFPDGYNEQNQNGALGTDHHPGVPPDSSEDGSALRLPEFFESLKLGEGQGVVVVHESQEGLTAGWHDVQKHGAHGGRTWEALEAGQKQEWKKKLKDAGYWAEDLGESILKGVVFGEIAGAVGQAVRGG